MPSDDQLKWWLQRNCPTFWTLLNNKAQKNLPTGLVQYAGIGSPSEIEAGQNNIETVEGYLCELERLCGRKAMGDNYRKDFSAANSENRLAELSCEIALCATLGRISGKLRLRPPTGKGTYSDCLWHFQGSDVYVESKRYADCWPHIQKIGEEPSEEVPYGRSIVKSLPTEKPEGTARPRSMDLISKLSNVHRQFPDGSLNLLFVFHPSIGPSDRYLRQALFGDSSFFSTNNDLFLEKGALFSIDEWRGISACCLCKHRGSQMAFSFIWRNPRAYLDIPQSIIDALELNT